MSARGYDKPLPKRDAFNGPFWDLAKQGKLAVQRCVACGHRQFPPGPVCSSCLGDKQDWETVSGKGTVASWVTFHRAYWDGFESAVPYDVCLVELDEGPLLVSNLVGTPGREPAVGDRVEAVFEQVTDEVTLPKFRVVRS